MTPCTQTTGEARAEYRVDEIRPGAEVQGEIAEFLAGFVRDGELSHPNPGEEDPAVWRGRLEHWWERNPYREEGEVYGYLLREGGGRAVGFLGFIPRDYWLDGERRRGLIATSFFVRQANRDASLGLFLRKKRLAQRRHVVDGTATEEVQVMLRRAGFEVQVGAVQDFLPVRSRGWVHPGTWANRILVTGAGGVERLEGRIVASPGEIGSVLERRTGKLHPDASREGLCWLMKSGSDVLRFAGWCDGEGRLRAYVLGPLDRRKGILGWEIMEHGSFDPEQRGALTLVRYLSAAPEEGARPEGIGYISMVQSGPGAGDGVGERLSWLRRRRPGWNWIFSMPGGLGGATKDCQLTDGDGIFL